MEKTKNNVYELAPKQRRIVETVLSFDEEENEQRIIYSHSTLCQTSLPFKNMGNEVREWKSRNGDSLVLIEAGQIYNPDINDMIKLGLPYGAKPRLVLLYLNSQAIKQQSPEIIIEDSFNAFIKRLGFSGEGRVYQTVKDQLAKLAASNMAIGRAEEIDEHGHKRGYTGYGRIVSNINLWFPKDKNQRVLWPNTIKLSNDYYNSLVKHAVPLDEAALHALKDSALELDLYAMLAERLHRIKNTEGQFISWANLYEQYGSGYKRIDNFRTKFVTALKNVHAVYPEANIDEEKSNNGRPQGIRLRHSKPPVQKLFVQKLVE